MSSTKNKFQKRVYTEEQLKERAILKRLIKQGKASRYTLAKGPDGTLERRRDKGVIFMRGEKKVAKRRRGITLRQVSTIK